MANSFSVSAMFKASDGMSPVMSQIEKRISKFSSSASSSLSSIDKANSKIISSFVDTAKSAAFAGAAIGTAIGAALWSVMGASNEVADGVAKVGSVMTETAGFSAGAAERMKAAALDWSEAHKTSARSFLDSSYMMVSAGLNEAAALAATRTASLMATATFGDSSQAASTLATVYNTLGNKTGDVNTEMARLGDVITKTQQTFQLKDLEQFTEGLKYAIPTSKMFGMSLEQTSTVLGLLNGAGLTGSQAGTAFTASMQKMIPAARELGFTIAKTKDGAMDFGGTLVNIHKKFGDFEHASDTTKEALEKAFGRRGIAAIALLSDGADKYADSLARVNDNAGVTATAAAYIEARGSGPLERLQNAWTNVKAAAGDALTPAFAPYEQKLDDVIKSTRAWLSANKDLVTGKVTEFLNNARFAMDLFANGLKKGFTDAKASMGPFADLLGKLAEHMADSGTWPGRVRELGVAFGWLSVVGGAFLIFAGSVKVARVAVIAFDGAVAAAKGAVWAWNAALGAYEVAAKGARLATILSTAAVWAGRAAARAVMIAQWAWNAAVSFGTTANKSFTFGQVASKIATIATTAWTWLANTAQTAYNAMMVAGGVAASAYAVELDVAKASTVGMESATGVANLTMKGFLGTLGAAALAIGALYEDYKQFNDLLDVSGGWEGMKNGIGSFLGGNGYFKGVDDYQTVQAREEADARDGGAWRGATAPQLVGPSPYSQPAGGNDSGSGGGGFYGEITVHAAPGTSATVTKPPSGGHKLNLAPSGSP